MAAMKAEHGRSNSPLHVHVANSTPVHLHVKKKKKKERGVPTAIEERIKQSHERLACAASKATSSKSGRLKEKRSPPFIPPPGRTSGNTKKSIAWEGDTHRLEISRAPAGILRNSLHMEDLQSSEEEESRDKMRMYEKTIGNLVNEVETLKNEVSMYNGSRVIEKQDEHLNASKRVIEEQEHELLDYREELKDTLTKNKELTTSMEWLRGDANRSRSEVEIVAKERDVLVRKLVEAEMAAKSTSSLVLKLKDTVHKLKEDKRMSSVDVVGLIRQKEGLLRKLADFEETNKALRKLLKEQSHYETNGERQREREDVLLQRLTETDSEYKKLKLKLHDREREVEALVVQVEADKNQAMTFQELKKTMEATRGHLQKELRTRDMECERLSVHLKTTDQKAEQDRVEAEHMRGLVEALREKSQREKDALKRAARIQKDRASELEKDVNQLKGRMAKELTETKLSEDVLKDKLTKCRKEKSVYDAKIDKLQSRIDELEKIIEHTENASKNTQDALTTKLQTQMREVNTLRSENEKLKVELDGFEERLKSEEQRNFTKIDRYRREAEEARTVAQEKEEQVERIRQEGHIETEKVRIGMQQRIAELEPVSELFKASELRLRDSQDKMLDYERRSSDHKQLISELTQKVEMQSDQLEDVREKWRSAVDHSKECEKNLEDLKRKYEQLGNENRELFASVGRREEALNQLQENLDEKKDTVSKLTYQLEAALADARRQAETQREKALAKERASQARMADLEAQLSRSTANGAQIKRERDEVERRFSSRLNDMRDRLEQANATTRSMQNYVSFLKSSYSTVFEDLDEGRLSPR